MNNKLIIAALASIMLFSCSDVVKNVDLSDTGLRVVNREISSIDEETNSLALNAMEGAGMAILEELDFEVGSIEIDLKGENNPGRSFIGIAFNIQNDSTYEAIYFRPFNFQSEEKIRREHSLQYVSEPEHSWFDLRENFEGQYEAEWEKQPSPDDWFSIKLNVTDEQVSVYDIESGMELLAVNRLQTSKTSDIALWTGHNSKGEFRNLRIERD